MTETKSCNILYLEDDYDDAFLFKRALTLSTVPCEVHSVGSVEQARNYLCGQADYADRGRFPFPDLVLTDLAVDGESGLDFIVWLRNSSAFSHLPIICLTGCDDPQILARLSQFGIEVISKTSVF